MPSSPKVFSCLLAAVFLVGCDTVRSAPVSSRGNEPDNVMYIGGNAPVVPAVVPLQIPSQAAPAPAPAPVAAAPVTPVAKAAPAEKAAPVVAAAPAPVAQAAPAPSPAAPRPSESVNTYRLRPRDFIRVLVLNETDTQIERRINPDGTIDLPFLKQIVPVAGLTLTQAQDDIAARFRKYFKDPQVVISIVSYAERRVYVSGYVGKPGPVSIPPEETLTLGRALSMAGGILPRGRRTDVAVKRMRNGVMEVISKNMRKIDSGDEPDFVLEDEDQVYVDDSRI